MAKDINKILKTIDHFGEGTFDDIDQIIQSEQSIISSIDKEILGDITGEESSLDIDIDSILGEDLKSLGVPTKENENQEIITEEVIAEPEVETPEIGLEVPVNESAEGFIGESLEIPSGETMETPISEEIEAPISEGLEGLQGLEELDLGGIEESTAEATFQPEVETPEIGLEVPVNESAEGFIGESLEIPSGETMETPISEEIEAPISEGLEGLEGLEELDLSHLEDLHEKETKPTGRVTKQEVLETGPQELVHENIEIPDEFVDLSIAAGEIPFEAEISHEKAPVDYSNIQISDEDIHIIINTLKNYPVWLSTEIKNLILNDALSPSELEGLIDLLSNNVHWKGVFEYLKNSLNIDLSYHLTPEEKVYIPTLTEKVLPYIKWIGAITILSIVVFVIIFQFFIIPNQAQHYYQTAINVLEKENNVEVAMQNFNRAASMRKYEKWYLKFGRLLLERNYLESAEQIALRGKNIWPDSLSFYELLSDVYFAKGGDKNISRAFTILEDLLADRNFASNPATYEAIAKRYESINQYQEAIKIYSEGLRHFQPTFEYLVKMLNNFIILRNFDAATDLYSKIDKKYKKLVDPEVFTKYSQFLLDFNQPFEAKDVFDKVLKYKPNYAPAYLPYAHYYEQMNQPEVALQGLLKAEKYINLGQYKETKEIVFDKILNEIGELYYNKNDDTLAYTYFEKAIDVNPDFAKAYYNIGRLNYFFYNRYQQALNNLVKSQDLGFSNDIQKYMIGWIYYHLGNYEQALFSFLQLELEHLSNIDLKLAIGNSHIKFGKAELAIGYLANYVTYWENMERQLRGRDLKNPKRQEALIKLAVGYNNLGVAYAILAKQKKSSAYESESLRLFIRSQEIYNFIYPGRVSNAESYINAMYLLHPEVKRDLLLMDDENYFPKIIF